MSHMRAHGGAVRLVALVDQEESRFIHRLFDEMEAELKAQASLALTRPAVETATVEVPIATEAVEYATAI